MERVLGSIPKCQPCKCFDFYFLFALVSVNFYGFCWLGEGDLEMCSSWLLIFDFVSAICLPYGFWKKIGNISWWVLKMHDVWAHSLCLHILCTAASFSLWTAIQGFWYCFFDTALLLLHYFILFTFNTFGQSSLSEWILHALYRLLFCHISGIENTKSGFSLRLHSQGWILHINEFLYKCLGFYTNPIPLLLRTSYKTAVS